MGESRNNGKWKREGLTLSHRPEQRGARFQLTMQGPTGGTFTASVHGRSLDDALVNADDAASAEQLLDHDLAEPIEQYAQATSRSLHITSIDIESRGGAALDAGAHAAIARHVSDELATSAQHGDAFDDSWRASAADTLTRTMKKKAWRLLVHDLPWARRIRARDGSAPSTPDDGAAAARALLNLTGRRIELSTAGGRSITLAAEPIPDTIARALAPPGRCPWHGLAVQYTLSPPAGTTSDADLAGALAGALAESSAKGALVAEPVLAQLTRALARCTRTSPPATNPALTDIMKALSGRIATPDAVHWDGDTMVATGVRTL